mmetsp:Transcript_78825/g.92130  ORF Transcript_78825/g.92130 Transcript_78825/m.92130 type:complete len:83 (-) Transcript_78825:9-257(-)
MVFAEKQLSSKRCTKQRRSPLPKSGNAQNLNLETTSLSWSSVNVESFEARGLRAIRRRIDSRVSLLRSSVTENSCSRLTNRI